MEDEDQEDEAHIDENAIKLKGEFKEICQIPEIRVNSIVLAILMSISSFCFFLINFSMKKIKGSLIKNTLTSQAAEFTADLTSGLVYFLIGPKKAFVIMYLLSMTGIVLLTIYYDDVDLIPIFIIMGKYGISSTFNMVFIAYMQLIPTIFTSSVFGIGNFTARMLSAFSPLFAEMSYPVPLVLNIAACFIASVSSFFLKEKLPRFI